MTRRKIKSLFAVCMLLASMQAYADDNVDITLNSVANLSPQLRDGQRIGQGQIQTQQAHRGFQVWLEAPRSSEAPNRYILMGKNNRQHKLFVIIGQAGWQPDSQGGLGIIKLTRDRQARFDIVVNGGQYAPIDTYTVTVQGRYLEP